MVEKKKLKKDKIENSQVDLKEILGDIKTVVSGEKETLFKLSEYKTINLKKENLVKSGKKDDPLYMTTINDGELKSLIRSIVKDEIGSLQFVEETAKVSTGNTKAKKISASNSLQLEGKIKPISVLNKMTKKELEEYGRNFGFEVDRRLTKNNIINQVKKLK